MIPEVEIRRAAVRLGVDPMLVELDYVLGCFLGALFGRPEARVLRFKGGTCLRKCYIPDYRFSEDLDFTLVSALDVAGIEAMCAEAAEESSDTWAVDLRVRPWRVEVVNDDYGMESYRIRIYYRGPLSRTRGDPRAIRLDVSRQETLVFPCRDRAILHGYGDAEKLAHIRVPCYDLREMAVEKLRALAGQRRYAVSRDLYDVVQLLTLLGGDAPALLFAFPAKWHVKGLSWGAIDLQHLAARRAEFLEDWNNHLLRVLPAIAAPDFDDTWQKACVLVADLNRRAAGPKP